MKQEKYTLLIKEAEALLQGEQDLVASLANIAALLKSRFGFWWVGFYLVRNNELVLGPFQGPVACTRIAFGKGVCGTAWKESASLVVPDVHAFPGHIACSAESKSELVVPVIQNGVVKAVLDIDSTGYNDFDNIDRQHCEQLCAMLSDLF